VCTMKLFGLCLVAIAAVSASSSDLEPAVVEVVGTGASMTFDTGSCKVETTGLHFDSSTDSNGLAQARGCTKIDDACVQDQLADVDAALDSIGHPDKNHLKEHTDDLTVTLPDLLGSKTDDLALRVDKLDALNPKLDDLRERAAKFEAKQAKITQRMEQAEHETHMLGTTTTTTTTTTPVRVVAYGEDASKPGRSCFEILGHYLKKDKSASVPSGTYWIDSEYDNLSSKPIKVYCDMERDGGGWALVQKGGTQGCFISAVGELKSPIQANNAKLSDTRINALAGHLAGTSRWLHGSPNWKDYGGDAKNAAPAATKIFFRGKIESSSSTANRPFFCGSTPSGTTSVTYDENPNAKKEWQKIPGYSAHFGFDTFQSYGGRFGESIVRNCGVVEQEHLYTDGVDNRHCSGNHYCKGALNYAGNQYKGLPEGGYRGMGSYFIGCYGEYNALPAETSGCKLGGKPGCMTADMDSATCGVRAQMKDGYCNGINWDAHAHGGCTDGNPSIDGGCRHCIKANGRPGCDTERNDQTKYEWPPLDAETMTMWVRPERPVAKQFGTPYLAGNQLCFDFGDVAKNSADGVLRNRMAADQFCRDHGYSRAQAHETAKGSNLSECMLFDDNAPHKWVLLSAAQEGKNGMPSTQGYRIVRIECINV